MLNLFLSARELPGLAVLDVGFDRIVEFMGVLFDMGVLDAVVVLVVVGLLTPLRLVVGLVALPLRVEEEVAVDVRRVSAGAAALEVVVRSVVEGTIDILFGFAAIPPRFDSSSVVFSSGDVTDDLSRWVARVGVVAEDVGFRAEDASVGLAGGLLRLEVAVLVADDAVGLDSRSARLVGRAVVDGFVTGFFTVLLVPARLILLVGSSPAAWLRDNGLSMMKMNYSVHNTHENGQEANMKAPVLSKRNNCK